MLSKNDCCLRAVYVLLTFLLTAASTAAAPTKGVPTTGAAPPAGFVALFNGQDLTGWRGFVGSPKERQEMSAEALAKAQAKADGKMSAHWKVVEGVLEFDGHGDNLCSDQLYGDFELYVDWKILEGGDSGIYLRGSPQVQIWDPDYQAYHRHGAEKGSGALWNNARHSRFPLVKADNPVGEWNTFFIRMIGERVTIQLNGQLVVDNVVMENLWERDKPIYVREQIELQNHGNRLWFRNIYLREIPPDEANERLSQSRAELFQPVFNGRDLEGWAGAVDSYDVRDGAIVCKLGKGGTLFTRQEYANFVAQLEFQLTPAGNNGIAIRYQGEGEPHLDGMCEIQILDSTHPIYSDPSHPDYYHLDPRQDHGSVYGLVAAHPGYLRPVGQWNFQQVTVSDSRIKIELNGFTILDADIAAVKESKDGKLYPNVHVKRGHFGFAGHSDPVAFRNVKILDLGSAELSR